MEVFIGLVSAREVVFSGVVEKDGRRMCKDIGRMNIAVATIDKTTVDPAKNIPTTKLLIRDDDIKRTILLIEIDIL